MTDLFDNPMGLAGLRVRRVRLADARRARAGLREAWASRRSRSHRSKDVALYRQGEINFIVNREPGSAGRVLRRRARAVGVRHGVSRARRAPGLRARPRARRAADRDADRADGAAPAGDQGHRRRAALPDRPLRGRPARSTTSTSSCSRASNAHPRGHGLAAHRPPDAQRLPRPHGVTGRDFYERLFNFREMRYFDIKGEYTGLTSQGDDGARRQDPHPAERGSRRASAGQIEEFLMQFNGEGIQHIALLTDDLLATRRRAAQRRRAADDGAARHLLRDARRAPARARRDRGRAAGARHPARRQQRRAAQRACCCRSSRRRCSARSSSSSSSARATKDSAKATSRRCSNRSSATRSSAGC